MHTANTDAVLHVHPPPANVPGPFHPCTGSQEAALPENFAASAPRFPCRKRGSTIPKSSAASNNGSRDCQPDLPDKIHCPDSAPHSAAPRSQIHGDFRSLFSPPASPTRYRPPHPVRCPYISADTRRSAADCGSPVSSSLLSLLRTDPEYSPVPSYVPASPRSFL